MALIGDQRKETPVAAAPAKPQKPTVSVRLARVEDLAAYEPRWRDLAARATVTNPFFEPFMLLPAIAHLGVPAEHLRFLLVTVAATGPEVEERLLGFFPLEIQNSCLHVPVKTLALWQYRYCCLTVPLIEKGHEWPVLEAFWRWFENNPLGCRLLDTNYLPLDAAFHNVWSDFAIGRLNFVINEHARALMDGQGTADEYLGRTISAKHAHEHKRLIRRLQDAGEMRYERLEKIEDLDTWCADFLRLEASGWKGTDEGDAIAKEEENAKFFREMTRKGFENGSVMMLALTIGGKPVAMKHNVIGQQTAFGYKIAFDETFAKWSPGFLLEIQHVREIFTDAALVDMDSCAMPRHPMADRIFSERRLIRRSVISNGSRMGDLIVSTLPLLRCLRTMIRPKAVMPYLQISTRRNAAEH